jgi:hypothetical protein
VIYTILPSQKEVYESMVSGRHLCIEDGEPFSALSRNEEDYKTLFTGLGMELVSDPRGFYYLGGGAVGWLTRPNTAPVFGGRRPLDIVLAGQVQPVIDYLQAAVWLW